MARLIRRHGDGGLGERSLDQQAAGGRGRQEQSGRI
jgi:hypothetical protein